LLELSRRSREPHLTLFLESIDDVHLEDKGLAVDILQLKHHLEGGADLTDTSPDLWRSIGVWLDLLEQLRPEETPFFVLVSTSEAPSDSAAAALAAMPGDVDRALGLLVDAAADSTNGTTEFARRRFLSLEPATRRRLVSAVQVRPGEPRLAELDDLLAETLSLHLMLKPAAREAFLDRLKGWWYSRCVVMLNSGSGVNTQELARFVSELRDSFHPEDLPPSFDLTDPTEAELATYRASVFVQQLLWIAYSNNQLLGAIRDYHRAFTQRSKWARQGLIYPGELDQYEQKLVDQWRRVFDDMVTELAPSATEMERAQVGRQLLQRLRDSDAVRLRPRYSDVMLTHGTLHHLANRREVGWHPEFQKRLETLLTGAA
jgi:hypothetical protein